MQLFQPQNTDRLIVTPEIKVTKPPQIVHAKSINDVLSDSAQAELLKDKFWHQDECFISQKVK